MEISDSFCKNNKVYVKWSQLQPVFIKLLQVIKTAGIGLGINLVEIEIEIEARRRHHRLATLDLLTNTLRCVLQTV